MFKSINKDYKIFSCLRGSIITIEGLIAAGKSTLGYKLSHFLNSIGIDAKYYPEYVNNDFLSLYIRNMKKYSFSFQVLMLMKRIEIYKEAEQFSKTGGIAIVDRSINGDYTFAYMQYLKGFFDDDDWNAYNALITKEALIEPHITLYLDCNPETCMRRLLIRGNISETRGYTIEYMIELDKAYKDTMTKVKHQVLNIDWNNNLDIDNEVLKVVLLKIKNELN
jgi:deoxyadenosine/deoxycytidine kinase